jgi:hypothetical protein
MNAMTSSTCSHRIPLPQRPRCASSSRRHGDVREPRRAWRYRGGGTRPPAKGHGGHPKPRTTKQTNLATIRKPSVTVLSGIASLVLEPFHLGSSERSPLTAPWPADGRTNWPSIWTFGTASTAHTHWDFRTPLISVTDVPNLLQAILDISPIQVCNGPRVMQWRTANKMPARP